MLTLELKNTTVNAALPQSNKRNAALQTKRGTRPLATNCNEILSKIRKETALTSNLSSTFLRDVVLVQYVADVQCRIVTKYFSCAHRNSNMQGFPNFVGQLWSYNSSVLINISLGTQLFHILNFNEGSILKTYVLKQSKSYRREYFDPRENYATILVKIL
jgi:hypothetical protein